MIKIEILCGVAGAGYFYRFDSKSDLEKFLKLHPELVGEAENMLEEYEDEWI